MNLNLLKDMGQSNKACQEYVTFHPNETKCYVVYI